MFNIYSIYTVLFKACWEIETHYQNVKVIQTIAYLYCNETNILVSLVSITHNIKLM